MAQRLVLTVKDEEVELADILAFADHARKCAVSKTEIVNVQQIGKSILFGVPIPDDRLITGEKKPRPKKKTAKQIAVEKQIAEHKEKKANGIKEAYVPPVGRTGPVKGPRVKCPVCNVRKKIAKVGSTQTIKPHIAGGEPCPGGGTQVVKVGRSYKVVS